MGRWPREGLGLVLAVAAHGETWSQEQSLCPRWSQLHSLKVEGVGESMMWGGPRSSLKGSGPCPKVGWAQALEGRDGRGASSTMFAQESVCASMRWASSGGKEDC